MKVEAIKTLISKVHIGLSWNEAETLAHQANDELRLILREVEQHSPKIQEDNKDKFMQLLTHLQELFPEVRFIRIKPDSCPECGCLNGNYTCEACGVKDEQHSDFLDEKHRLINELSLGFIYMPELSPDVADRYRPEWRTTPKIEGVNT